MLLPNLRKAVIPPTASLDGPGFSPPGPSFSWKPRAPAVASSTSRSMFPLTGIVAMTCPPPLLSLSKEGRGRDPARQRWEGEVWCRSMIVSGIDTHLTRSPRSRPLPPQAGGEVLVEPYPAKVNPL